MIKKYKEFINESFEMILESNVVYSDRMKLVLSKIDNPISDFLIGIENNDLDVKANFFDVPTDKNDKLSFTPDRKAQEILNDNTKYVRFNGRNGGWLRNKSANKTIFDALGYTYEEGTEPYNPNSYDTGKVISEYTSEKSGNTYVYVIFFNENVELGKGVYNKTKLREISIDNSKLVWSKNRQEVNIGKAIKALLDLGEYKFTAKELEQYVNQFKATIDKLNDKFSYFELVQGESIAYWYNYKNYLDRSGSLGNSCMSNVDDEYFDIYMSNSDVCKLLILKSQENPNKIVGRALLWTLTGGEKYLDRIYTIKDSDIQLFKDYAKENGWYSKLYNNSSDSNMAVSPDGKDVSLNISVKLGAGDYDYYPYLDTLKYLDTHKAILSIEKTHGCLTLESTDGSYYTCEYCNGTGRESCYNCEGDGSIECPECEGSGEEKCDTCHSNGEIECETCNGTGEEYEDKECDDCNGSGLQKCEDCSNGYVTCDRCDGEGEVECYNCDGEGEVECSECS